MKLFDYLLKKPTLIALSCFYLLICSVIAFKNIPFFDTLYYWNWSQHLELSYLDGPPLIAYLFYLNNKLFGSSQLAINLFAIITNGIISIIIFYLANILFNKRIAKIALLIWLSTQFIFIRYVLMAGYDSALALFWLATLCFLYKSWETQHIKYFYLTGFCAGLALLGKYQAILLWASIPMLLIFCKPYRVLLTNKHSYFSALLAIIMFLPVIIWNWQHHFASFNFQLHHGFHHHLKFKNIISYFLSNLKSYNLFFLIFLFYSIKDAKRLITNPKMALLIYPAWAIFIFFLICAPFNVAYNWNQAYFLTAVIIVAYYINQYRFIEYLTFLSLFVGIILILNMAIDRLVPWLGASGFYTDRMALQQLNNIPRHNIPLFADGYVDASRLSFFINEHPPIYMIKPESEYYYWSQAIIKKIHRGEFDKAYYVSVHNSPGEMLKLFKHCHLQQKFSAAFKKYNSIKHSNFFLFLCREPAKQT